MQARRGASVSRGSTCGGRGSKKGGGHSNRGVRAAEDPGRTGPRPDIGQDPRPEASGAAQNPSCSEPHLFSADVRGCTLAGNSEFVQDQEIGHFGGLGGPGGPGNPSKRCGASPRTFWEGFLGGAAQTPKMADFRVPKKFRYFLASQVRPRGGRGNPGPGSLSWSRRGF